MSGSSGTTKEAFIATFSKKRTNRENLATRVRQAKASITHARSTIAWLPDDDDDRVSVEGGLANLEARIDAQVNVGLNKPGKAWRAMRDLVAEAHQKDTAAQAFGATGGGANQRSNARLKQIRDDLARARKDRREVTDDVVADRLRQRIDDLEQRVDHAGGIATSGGGSDGAAVGALDALGPLRAEAAALAQQVATAKGTGPAQAGKRSASRDVVEAMKGVPALQDKLNSTEKDAQGRTPMEHVRAALDAFDDHFAHDVGGGADAARTDTAMRVATVVNVTAQKMAKELNDPRLKPLIAKSLMREYAGEMAEKLAPSDDDEDGDGDDAARGDAEKAIALAQALVMDDPLTKVLTKKITPEDAVQRVRDMAGSVGAKPSEVFSLLKKQFQMELGSLSMDEVRKGEVDKDPGKTFLLKDLYGELSTGQVAGEERDVYKNIDANPGLVNVNEQAVPNPYIPTNSPVSVQGQPQWRGDGTGLDFKPEAQQLLDNLGKLVGAWDGPEIPHLDLAGIRRTRDGDKPGAVPSEQELDRLRAEAKKEGITPTPKALRKAAAELHSPTDALARAEALTAAAEVFDNAAEPAPRDDTFRSAVGAVADAGDVAFINKLKRALPKKPGTLDQAALTSLSEALHKRADRLRKDGQAGEYVPAPGLPQDHAVRAPLADPQAEARRKKFGKAIDWANLDEKGYLALRIDHDAVAQEAMRQGALTQKQYEHLKGLLRADREEKEAFEDPEGQNRDMEGWVLDQIKARYQCDDNRATRLLDLAREFMLQVPLTITFEADRWFSTKDNEKFADSETTHGPQYTSDVVYTRKPTDVKDVIGRDEHQMEKPKDAGEDKSMADGVGRKEYRIEGLNEDEADEVPNEELTAELLERAEGLSGAVEVFRGAKEPADRDELVKQAAGLLDDPDDQQYLRDLAANFPEALDGGAVAGAVLMLRRRAAGLRREAIQLPDDGKTRVPKAGVTGGVKGGWDQTRGPNYMRWRTEKDEREGRLDTMPHEDQQVFGAANPSFEKLKGGSTTVTEDYGVNYYGDCHLLLKDAVRKRSAFIIRGQGAFNPVQRRELVVLIHDMFKGGAKNTAFLDALLLRAEKKDKTLVTGLEWEVHLYGGFDLRTDVEAIYLGKVDATLKSRIEQFAGRHRIRVESVGGRPDALEVIRPGGQKTFDLDS